MRKLTQNRESIPTRNKKQKIEGLGKKNGDDFFLDSQAGERVGVAELPDSLNIARQRRALGRFQPFDIRGCKNGLGVAQGVEN